MRATLGPAPRSRKRLTLPAYDQHDPLRGADPEHPTKHRQLRPCKRCKLPKWVVHLGGGIWHSYDLAGQPHSCDKRPILQTSTAKYGASASPRTRIVDGTFIPTHYRKPPTGGAGEVNLGEPDRPTRPRALPGTRYARAGGTSAEGGSCCSSTLNRDVQPQSQHAS